MQTKSDVVLVSCYGRAHWLAAELANMNLSVTLVDVSEALGRWTPEDWEGPFGVFNFESLESSQKTRLDAEVSMQMNDRGFTVWTRKGPIEARGPLASYQLQKAGVSEQFKAYLEKNLNKDKEMAQIREEAMGMPFKKSWYFQLCHNFSSNQFTENTHSLLNKYVPPVLGEHHMRRASRRSYEQSLKWLEDLGVKVLRQSVVTDIMMNSRFIQNIEVKSDWTGVLSADQFIWSLTSLETERLSLKCYQALFDFKLQPQWNWQRYRVQIDLDSMSVLPEHFIFVDEVGLTWTHENFMVFQKTELDAVYDVWMRLPFTERFHRSYLEEKIKNGMAKLSARNSGIQTKIQDMPQEYLYDEADLGPPRLPVYSREDFVQHKSKSWINLMYDCPEQWSSLEWTGIFEYQKGLREVLAKWKQDRDQRRMKAQTELKSDEAEVENSMENM